MESKKDSYYTFAAPCQGEYKEKGSKFLAYGFPFDDTNHLTEIIKNLKTEHPKARHHCFAYEIGWMGDQFRSFDDGEPSGTAGKPIYGQIKSAGLTNVLIVVVRYFGGTKLGASGLIQAYKAASQECINNAEIIEKYVTSQYLLEAPYDKMGFLFNVLKKLNVVIIDKSFTSGVEAIIGIRKSLELETILLLKAELLEISLEQVNEETVIPWCSFTLKEEVHV